MKEKKKKLTTASGRPYFENEDSVTRRPGTPLLMQDYKHHEKLANVLGIKFIV